MSKNRKNVLILAASVLLLHKLASLNLYIRFRCMRMHISVLFSRSLRNLISRGYCLVIIPRRSVNEKRGKVLMCRAKLSHLPLLFLGSRIAYPDWINDDGNYDPFLRNKGNRKDNKGICMLVRCTQSLQPHLLFLEGQMEVFARGREKERKVSELFFMQDEF